MWKACERLTVFTTAVLLFAAATGCGSHSYGGNNICTTQTLAKDGESVGTASYTLTVPGAALVMYPGQTVTLPVTVNGTGSGQVNVSVTGLPSGLSVAPVTIPVGGTGNLTFVSTLSLATECFHATALSYQAYSVLAVQGASTLGSSTTGHGFDVVLENPAFKPTKTDLTVMDIETTGQAAIVSEDDYLTGSVSIVDPANKKNNYSGTMQVKGHGNTTWSMPKKPYRLKLDSKSGLLGMNSEKNWILLANYDDKTMLRDALASEISAMSGLPWSPQSRFVELMLNGAYAGTYQLIENIDINKNRVNIADSDTNDDVPSQNGFLLQIDQRQDDSYNWITPHGVYVSSEDPDPPTAAEEPYITDLVNAAEASMYAPNAADATAGWRSKWDQDSVVDWFLTNELMGNQDAIAVSSDYFYKDAGDSPFVMGPVWDFDISSGNDNYGAIQDPGVPWVAVGHPWYAQLMKDPTFVAAVKTRWAAMRSQVSTLPSYLDTNAATLELAASNNYQRWLTLHQKVWPNPETAGSYDGEVAYLKQWLASRVSYMDKTYGQ